MRASTSSFDVAKRDTSTRTSSMHRPTLPDATRRPPCNPDGGPSGRRPISASGVNTGALEAHPSLTSDELMMFFARDTGAGPPRAVLRDAHRYRNRDFGAVAAQATRSAIRRAIRLGAVRPWTTWPWRSTSTRCAAAERHLTSISRRAAAAPTAGAARSGVAYLNVTDPPTTSSPFGCSGTSEIWFASDRYGSTAPARSTSTCSRMEGSRRCSRRRSTRPPTRYTPR